jgi:hypothetical protein
MISDLHSYLSGVPGRTPDERMSKLVAFADRMSIVRLCVQRKRLLKELSP